MCAFSLCTALGEWVNFPFRCIFPSFFAYQQIVKIAHSEPKHCCKNTVNITVRLQFTDADDDDAGVETKHHSISRSFEEIKLVEHNGNPYSAYACTCASVVDVERTRCNWRTWEKVLNGYWVVNAVRFATKFSLFQALRSIFFAVENWCSQQISVCLADDIRKLFSGGRTMKLEWLNGNFSENLR